MKLEIYMKSGNKIALRGVKDWAIKWNVENDSIVSLSITYHKWALIYKKLIIGSICLSQIEAITKSKLF